MFKGRTDGGAVAVEFAIIFPVFLFMLLFMLDVGRYLTVQMALNNAAQVGARYVAISTDTNTTLAQVTANVPEAISNLATLDAVVTGSKVKASEWICPLNSESFTRRDTWGNIIAAPDDNCYDLTQPAYSSTTCANIGPNYRAMERVDVTFKWITPFGLIASIADPNTDFQNSSIFFNRNQTDTTTIEGKAKLICQN